MNRIEKSFLGIRILATPCWCLLSFLIFILYKNFHLTPLQITIVIALKPISSLLVPYWSQAIYQRPDKIFGNLIRANIFRHLPFLFIPWLSSPWFLVASFGCYMMLTRAMMPAWMELLKSHSKREKLVSYGTTIDHLGTAILAVLLGMLLDANQHFWKWLFSLASGLGMASTLFLIGPKQHLPVISHAIPLKEKILMPWSQIRQVLLQRKDFVFFQAGFMLGGGGLMLMQPALPKFFVDTLHLSFTEMGTAIALCKGLGVALTAPLWTRLFRKVTLFQLSALVTLFASFFPLLLAGSVFHLSLLYLAYMFYGFMQSGSELSWHMSGPVFAQDKDSSPFSSINVLTVGLRGCFIPALGATLLPFLQPFGVMILGAILCVFASACFVLNSHARVDYKSK